MNKEKWYEKLKTRGQSITVPMTLLMIAVAVIPLLLQTWILIGSFKQNQIEARGIEIQNQCVILSNRMTRSGYLTADKTNNVSLDAQMQTIADLYNGRIVIVNSSYKIMTDTFNLSTGKYYISESNRENETIIKESVIEAAQYFVSECHENIGVDIVPDKLIEVARVAGAKRLEITSPVFTQVTETQIAICDSVELVYGGLEDD